MDATVISMLPVSSAVIPALPFASAPDAAELFWFLAGAGVAVGVSMLVVSARAIAAALEDLIGRTTAGTVAEPVGELLLEGVARVAGVRWYLADVVLAWHPAIGDAPTQAPEHFGRPALSRAA